MADPEECRRESWETFYGDALPELSQIRDTLLCRVEELQAGYSEGDHNPIEHCKVRIKSPESMREKLRRKGLPQDVDTALAQVRDGVGMRLVCTFPDSVYQVAAQLRRLWQVVEEKDYIRTPKPNGYRSYHMILAFPAGEAGRTRTIYAEVQLRTIAMDCWASLEHQLKYKHSVPNQQLIVRELKRCADELASADLTMQTIHELLSRTEEPRQEARKHETAAGGRRAGAVPGGGGPVALPGV